MEARVLSSNIQSQHHIRSHHISLLTPYSWCPFPYNQVPPVPGIFYPSVDQLLTQIASKISAVMRPYYIIRLIWIRLSPIRALINPARLMVSTLNDRLARKL